MEIPEYTDEETDTMRKGFQRLRRSNSEAKVPFFWVEKAGDGHPRLFVGIKGKAKVPGSLTNPARRTAKDKKNISQGIAWKNESQGITFQVLRGAFRINKAKRLIKLMEKALKLKLGKIEVYAMDADEAARVGQSFVSEIEEENKAFTEEANAKQQQAAGLKDVLTSLERGGSISESLDALPPGTISDEQKRVILSGSPSESGEALKRLLAQKELEELEARAQLVVLSPKEHNKLITGAYAKAEASSMKWRSRLSLVRDPKQPPPPWDASDEWELDTQVHEEFMEDVNDPEMDCSADEALFNTHRDLAEAAKTQILEVVEAIASKGDDLSELDVKRFNTQLANVHATISGHVQNLNFIHDRLQQRTNKRLEMLDTQRAFYVGRLKFDQQPLTRLPDAPKVDVWDQHPNYGKETKRRISNVRNDKSETKRYLPIIGSFSSYVTELVALAEAQNTLGKDHLLRFNLLPEQQAAYDELIETRNENIESKKSEKAAKRALGINKKIRAKTRQKEKLQAELKKLKNSFFKRKKTKSRIKEIEALLPDIDNELKAAEEERDAAKAEVDDVLTEVVEATNRKAVIEQEIRDLKSKKKKSVTGKSGIQEKIDDLNAQLTTVNQKLDRASENSRAALVEPQARLDAANEAFTKKTDKRAALLREMNDLNKKLKKMVVLGRDKLKAKRTELQAKIAELDSEIGTLKEEQIKWAKAEMEFQSVEESIAMLKLDATTQRANSVEAELTEAIEEAGLGAKEREYQAHYAETKEKEETLQNALQAKAQTQLSIQQLKIEKSKLEDDQVRTKAECLDTVAKQREATAALAQKKQYLTDFMEPANQDALKSTLLDGGDLNTMFPTPAEDNVELRELRASLISDLQSQGIQTAESYTEEQVEAILTAKRTYLEKERDLLSEAAESAKQAGDLATAKARYVVLRDNHKTLLEKKASSEAELERLTGELEKLEEEYKQLREQRDKDKDEIKRLKSASESEKQAALEARQVMKDAKREMDLAEGEAAVAAATESYNTAFEDYTKKKSLYKETTAAVEKFSLVSQRGATLKKSIKIKKAACAHVKKQIGGKRKGFIHDINKTIDDVNSLKKKYPGAFEDETLQKEREDALKAIQDQIDAAEEVLNDNDSTLEEARNAYAENQKTLNDLEEGMKESIRSAPNAEELTSQIEDLHHSYRDQENAELERLMVESRGVAIEHREEINDIYANALDLPEDASAALEMFKNVEDIYEGSKSTGSKPVLGLFGTPTGPSQLQVMAEENPEEYAVAMAYVDKIVADVERLKALGQPQEKYMHLLSPIPRAFWPDTLITEAKEFAEIEELFANEKEDDTANRTNILKKAMASNVGTGLNTAIDYGNNLNGFFLCASDVHGLVGKSLDTASVAWPVAATVGVVLSAANMVQEVNGVLLERQERNELSKEKLDANELTDEQIREIREKLEKTGMDDLLSLGEGMTDLLYKSSFAAECFMSIGGTAGSVVPGIGVASTSVLLALKTKQCVDAYAKHADDVNMLDEIEVEEENAEDFALQGAMKNRAERSRQQAVLSTADAISAAGALTAQAGLVVSAATGPGAAVGGTIAALGWMAEAIGGALSAGLKAFYNISAARKAKATLKKAQQGSRRAMMDIFQNSATYSTQLMLKRATEGNKAAIRFCESKGITKGMLISDKMSKGILRKMLLEDADQKQEVEGGQNIREMWDSLNSAKDILDQTNTGASANDPGPTWFKVQNRLITAQLNAANRLIAPEGGLVPDKNLQLQVRNLEKMLQSYPAVEKQWEALKSDLEDEKRWKPASFDEGKNQRLENITTALNRIGFLKDNVRVQIDLMNAEIDGPLEWETVLFAA